MRVEMKHDTRLRVEMKPNTSKWRLFETLLKSFTVINSLRVNGSQEVFSGF